MTAPVAAERRRMHVTEECLLSVMALNLKRMVKAILLLLSLLKIRVESYNFQPGSLFVNRSNKLRKLNRG